MTSIPIPRATNKAFYSAFLACIMATCGCGPADELRVSAAASLADALKEIDRAFEQATGTGVRLNLGASSLLARQIEAGAPADVFFSADEARMDGLEKKGLIDPTTREAQLSNTLVVVVPADSTLALTSMKDLTAAAVRRIATGDPRAVPAGVYAKEHLQKIGVWKAVESRIVAMENVRAALAAVGSGNAEAGIVYKTDAAISKQVKIACEVPAGEGPRIVYPMAMVKAAGNVSGARAYLEFLDSAAAKKTFGKFGFVVLPELADKASRPSPWPNSCHDCR